MIPVSELDRIAAARLGEAQTLFEAGAYDGAIYLCGYAVEVALKAQICRTLNWPEFPRTNKEFESYRSFQTHDLNVLLRLSGKEALIRQHYLDVWSVVAVWNPELRYNEIGTTTPEGAEAMIGAAATLISVGLVL